MSNYEVTTVTVSGLKDNITLPKFQRGYVWNKTKKIELIDSLHKGFPFGSLLTYQKNKNEKEKLLDGQQRWTTILDYQKNKASYWKKLEYDKYQEAFKNINSLILSNEGIKEEEFDIVISGREDVADWVDSKFEIFDFGVYKAKEIREIIRSVINDIDTYLKIEDIQIPIIRYTGDESYIAQVFENLNKGGVQLTKFEIFAAAWTHNLIELENTDHQNEILENVKRYYLNKQDEAESYGFSLDGFSEDELTSSRNINLFELGLGLGVFIAKRLPSLVQIDSIKNTNEIGFGVLGIATNTDPKKLGELSNFTPWFNESGNLEDMLENIHLISSILNTVFDKLIKQNTKADNSGMDYHRQLTSTFKTLSYFSVLWRLDKSSKEWKENISNIPSYYVYDSINGVWGNAGDSRLSEYYTVENNGKLSSKRNYLSKINSQEFENSFIKWIKEENTQTERFSGEVKSLATIHANLTYLSDFVNVGDPLQFEHIYAKQRVRKTDKGRDVMLGRLGNVMYLPKTLNQNKKTKTLYEYEKYNSNYDKIIQESHYPSREDFDNAFVSLENNNFGDVNELILKRSKTVAVDIVKKLLANNF